MSDITFQSGPNGEIIFRSTEGDVEITLRELVSQLKKMKRLEETIAEMMLLGGLEFPTEEKT